VIAGLPDLPRWVEAHDLAAHPASWRRTLGAQGWCIGSERLQLICVWGEPTTAAIAELARELPAYTLLVPAECEEVARATCRATRRPIARAILHTLDDASTLPDYDGAAPLPAEASLAHLPLELAEELARARAAVTVWAAWVDGVPVSFAYAPARSTAWFSTAVDTAPGARQLGLATIVASAMIRAERAGGREPVWGATEDNVASLRIAMRLGFRAVDELWLVAPASAPPDPAA
jgi:hypothetical protein